LEAVCSIFRAECGHPAAGGILSILSPQATSPNALINLCFAGAVLLAGGLLTLGIGLLRSKTLSVEIEK